MATSIPRVILNTGSKMPILGLGTYAHAHTGERALVYQAVLNAIAAGYRHIDTAAVYDIEAEVGRAAKDAIAAGLVTRQELFIVTKLSLSDMQRDHVVPACRESLRLLDMDYVDLYLVHSPTALKPDGSDYNNELDIHNETWKGMEECVERGLAKNIGVSNYNSMQITELLKVAKVKPVTNQVEAHPFLSQRKLLDFCAERGIVLTAYSPMGGSPLQKDQETHDNEVPSQQIVLSMFDQDVRLGLFKNETILKLAEKHTRTPGQIMLKYQAQRGLVVIAKSVDKSRIVENANIFDFGLDPEDMIKLDALDRNLRYCHGRHFKGSKNNPFSIEF